MVDGKIYCISEDGAIKVIDASPEFRAYPGGQLGDPSYSTPAIANGRMYLKGFEKLAALKSSKPLVPSAQSSNLPR
jgi:outer membrane protein assembly factor BamB